MVQKLLKNESINLAKWVMGRSGRWGPTCKQEKATHCVHYVQTTLNFNVAMESTLLALVAMVFCSVRANNVTISRQKTVYIREIVFAMLHALYSKIVATITL